MPCPVKSTLTVSRDLASVIGSTGRRSARTLEASWPSGTALTVRGVSTNSARDRELTGTNQV
jgi:hypothetical protein